MGDDLMGLAVVVVIAGGAFYLLTKGGNFNLGPSEPDPNADADVSGGSDTGPVIGTGATSTGRCLSVYAGSCCIECRAPTSSVRVFVELLRQTALHQRLR